MELKNLIKRMLDENSFNYCEYFGCFDLAARSKEKIVFLKVLENIDSIQEDSANNLKILAGSISASSFIIGTHTSREKMRNNIIYERFEIPAVTPKTLESVINDEMPIIYRFRGGFFAEIDPDKLREKRIEKGLTQKDLAEKVGISKKSIYEHESKEMPASYKNVKKIESIIGEISKPVRICPSPNKIKSRPKHAFEKKVSQKLKSLGFAVSFVYKNPFNIIAEGKGLVCSDAEERSSLKKVMLLESFANTLEIPVIVITKEEVKTNLPYLQEKELYDLSEQRDILKLAKF